jgi:hypothetical protein
MAAKKKSAFAEASEAIIKAFHQLEHAVMGTATAKKTKAGPARKTTKKKAAKTAKKKTRK